MTWLVGYLGPEASFSHEAAMQSRQLIATFLKGRGFRNAGEMELHECRTELEIQTLIELGHQDSAMPTFGIVPLSNSKVGDVYDFLPFYVFDKVGEVRVRLDLCLCTRAKHLEDIRYVWTKDTAYRQVKDRLNELVPGAQIVATPDISTSAAASKAASDPFIAAVCSPFAAERYGLRVVAAGLQGDTEIFTTFGVFWNENGTVQIPKEQSSTWEVFTRGAAPYGRRSALVACLKKKESLVIKWGIDPLRPNLHLGHVTNLLMLRDLLEIGHYVKIVLGTFTGIIGDPSGNLERRPRINQGLIDTNANSLEAQIRKILGGHRRLEVLRNGDFGEPLTVRRLWEWMYEIEVPRLLSRGDFRERLQNGRPLSLAELAYSIFQAYDSLQLQPDVELGGADQLWNCMIAAHIMQLSGVDPQHCVLTELLPGIDGGQKMSSFAGNAIHVNEDPGAARDKILRLPQSLVPRYYMHLTREPRETILKWRDLLADDRVVGVLRERLAEEVIALLMTWRTAPSS